MWKDIIRFCMAHKVGVPVGIVGLVFVLITGQLQFGTISNPAYCASCHQTRYDDSSYAPLWPDALNPEDLEADSLGAPTIRIGWGVQVGCAECHPEVYFEFMQSIHGASRKTNRPGCLNCHETHSFGQFVGHMFFNVEAWKYGVGPMAAMKDNRIWEQEVRPRLAHKERQRYLANRSEQCRSCHQLPSGGLPFKPDLTPHRIADREKLTCIQCHYNLVHRPVEWLEAEINGPRIMTKGEHQ